ncbi:MAG: hypothetical protein WBA74_27750 [Cyclobacteriaceae bacterium]
MSIKNRIIIASTLKPVDDIRSYRKIGDSLGKTNNYDVKIIGYGPKGIAGNHNVDFIPMGTFRRISLKRVLLPFYILKIIIKQKPDLLIIQTHELIIAALCWKLLFPGCRLIYDIRENYYLNIMSQSIFPRLVRPLLAGWIRLKELVAARFINCYFIAEKGYLQEMDYLVKHDYLVLENKSVIRDFKKEKRTATIRKFAFTGNLSSNSGVLKAIDLFQSIQQVNPEVSLQITGHTPDTNFMNKLNSIAAGSNNISVNSSINPVDYESIVGTLRGADIGFVTYEVNESNINCIPTKVFEYLSIGLPFIAEKGTGWTTLGEAAGMVYAVDNTQIDYEELSDWYNNLRFDYDKRSFMWNNEVPKLLLKVEEILLE